MQQFRLFKGKSGCFFIDLRATVGVACGPGDRRPEVDGYHCGYLFSRDDKISFG